MNVISVVRHLHVTVILKGIKDLTLDRNSLNVVSVVRALNSTVIFKGIKKNAHQKAQGCIQCGKAFSDHANFQRLKRTRNNMNEISEIKPFHVLFIFKCMNVHIQEKNHEWTLCGKSFVTIISNYMK